MCEVEDLGGSYLGAEALLSYSTLGNLRKCKNLKLCYNNTSILSLCVCACMYCKC